MKLIAFGLILICCNVWAMKINVASKYNMMDEFLENKLRNILRNGDDTLGIPILDPLNMDRLEIHLNEEAIILDGVLSMIKAEGLSGYTVVKGDFSLGDPIVLIAHLSWPLVVASTNYSMKGKADTFEIYGEGKIDMSAYDFGLDLQVDLLMEGGLTGHLKIQETNLKLSLASLDFHITGLYNNEELSEILSAVISDMAPDLVCNEEIIAKLILEIRKIVDPFLASKTVLEILQMIM